MKKYSFLSLGIAVISATLPSMRIVHAIEPSEFESIKVGRAQEAPGKIAVDDQQLLDPNADHTWTSVTQIRGDNFSGGAYFGGSFVQRVDGKMLVTYTIGTNVMLSTVASEAELTGVTNASATNEGIFHTHYSPAVARLSQSRLQRLSNGRILLYLLEYGIANDPQNPFRVRVFESINGLGTDFVPKSTVYSTIPNATARFGANDMGQAIEVAGRIVFPLAIPVNKNGYNQSRLYSATSSDGGVTWRFIQILSDTSFTTDRGNSKGFGIAASSLVVLGHDTFSGGKTIFASLPIAQLSGGGPIMTNCPGTMGSGYCDMPLWTASAVYQQSNLGDLTSSHIFWQPDGFNYLLRDFSGDASKYNLYRRSASLPIDSSLQIPYQTGPIGSGATWEGPLTLYGVGDDGLEYLSMLSTGELAIHGTSNFGGSSIAYVRSTQRERLFAGGFDSP